MTYIDYLNTFGEWADENMPGDKVIILYYSFLALFNKRRWPESTSIDTPRLMSMAHTTNRNTALKARDELVASGFISYIPGKKGKATEYRLLNTKIGSKKSTVKGTINGINIDTQYDTEKEKDSECSTVLSINIDTQYGAQSDTHIEDIRQKIEDKDIINQRRCCGNEDLARVMSAYMDRINPFLSERGRDELAGFVDVMGADVCLRAIEIALENKAAKWPYIRAILQSKQAQGVRCIADWDELEEKRDKENVRNKGTEPQREWHIETRDNGREVIVYDD